MKERAINAVNAKRRIAINSAKATADGALARALSIDEIKCAHDRFVNLQFQASINEKFDESALNAALTAYREALNKHGFSESDFEYVPVCPICKDAGSVNGKVCECVWNDYIAALKAECRITEKAPFTFADCDLTRIRDEAQRKNLGDFYGFMQKYAAKLPAVNLKNILFTGSTGTGKTCLASATARCAVENGKSCKYLSAFEFNGEMLSAHVSPAAERTQKLHDVLTADLLVIDDLGVEPPYKNVTREYLLLVLEERTRAGLCTLITTNLDERDLQAKYGDRICSRLFDKKRSRVVKFDGADLRLI